MSQWHSRLVTGGFSDVPASSALVEVEYRDGEVRVTTGWTVRNDSGDLVRWRLFTGEGWACNLGIFPPDANARVEFVTGGGMHGSCNAADCRWSLTGTPADISWWRYVNPAKTFNVFEQWHRPATPKHSHYFKDVSKLQTIDVYRVLALYDVTDPCLQHAIKKLLVAGGRGGGKDITRDVQESIDTLTRWQEMQRETRP